VAALPALGPAVAAGARLVALLVLLKRVLGGFMTMFPMVATIAAYEARGPMMAAMWLLQRTVGVPVPLSLLVGWGVFLVLLVPIILARSWTSRTVPR
jgi:hypothetical protein